MKEIVAVVVLGLAIFIATYLFSVIGLLLTGVFAFLEHIPEWLWTCALLSLTVFVYRWFPSSTAPLD